MIDEQIDLLIFSDSKVFEPARRTQQSATSRVFKQFNEQASSLHRAMN